MNILGNDMLFAIQSTHVFNIHENVIVKTKSHVNPGIDVGWRGR